VKEKRGFGHNLLVTNRVASTFPDVATLGNGIVG
jgi:hypothetical protein